MRANIFAVALFHFCLGCTSQPSDELTPQQKDQVKNDVKVAVDSIIARWARRDVEGCLQYYSPDLAVVDDSLRHGYEEYKKLWIDYNKSLAAVKVTTIREDYIVCGRELVISTWVCRDENYLKSGDKMTIPVHAYTLVFRRNDGKWRVIYSHDSGIPVAEKAGKQ